jgi:monoamine oxidase
MPPGLATSHGDSMRVPVLEPIHPTQANHNSSASVVQSVFKLPNEETEEAILKLSKNSCRYSGIHFTCCELAGQWPGYFEGAIDSGYRTAAEIRSMF